MYNNIYKHTIKCTLVLFHDITFIIFNTMPKDRSYYFVDNMLK